LPTSGVGVMDHASYSLYRFINGEVLEQCQEACLEAFEGFLEQNAIINKEFSLVGKIKYPYSLIAKVRFTNNEFEGFTSVSLNSSEMERLFSKNIDVEMQIDALGELANVIAGSITCSDRHMEKFDILVTEPPVVKKVDYEQKQFTGVIGELIINNTPVYFSHTLWNKKFRF